jgi:exo-beta-1,3-glucanase (GH17 family)
VDRGEHRSSLALAQKVRPDPVKLTADFREYAIPLRAEQLTNLVDPFCVVASALDNPGKKKITVLVDAIRYEAPARGKKTGQLPDGWRERLARTFWVTYTPTGFDPTARPVKRPTAEAIRADLVAIRAVADKAGLRGGGVGIITYGCRDGLEQVPALAREAGLAVLLGVFNPRDEAEVRNAEAILRRDDLRDAVAGCCVGNEAITFRRATLEDIQKVVERLRAARRVPMTTTEIVQAYGDKRLFAFDFTLFNAHGLFAGVSGPEKCARWAVERGADVLAQAPKGHVVLAKEYGWPAGPAPHFDAAQQAAYWKAVLSDPVARRLNVCAFDGFQNVPWKAEPVTLPGGARADIGPHWAVLFGPDRRPTAFANEFLKLWSATRGR